MNNSPDFPVTDFQYFLSLPGLLYIYKTDMKIERIDIDTQYDTIFNTRSFFILIHLDERFLSFFNSNTQFEGGLMFSQLDSSVHIENVTFDLYKTLTLIQLHGSCASDNGYLPNTKIILESLNFFYSQSKNQSSII